MAKRKKKLIIDKRYKPPNSHANYQKSKTREHQKTHHLPIHQILPSEIVEEEQKAPQYQP